MTCGIPEMIQDESSGVWVKNPDFEWFMKGFRTAVNMYLNNPDKFHWVTTRMISAKRLKNDN